MFNIPHGIDSAIKKVLADIQSELFAIRKSGGMDTVNSSVTNIYSATGGTNTGRSGTTVLDEINGDFTIHGDLFVDGSIVAGGGMQACLEAITSGSTLCLTDVGGTDQTLTGNLGWLKFDTVSGVDFTDPTIWTNSGTEYFRVQHTNDITGGSNVNVDGLFNQYGVYRQVYGVVDATGAPLSLANAEPVFLNYNSGALPWAGGVPYFQITGPVVGAVLGGIFRLGDGNATEYFNINASGEVTFNSAFTFPNADGAANTALVTDGAGNVDFTALTGTHVTMDLSDLGDVDSAAQNIGRVVWNTASANYSGDYLPSLYTADGSHTLTLTDDGANLITLTGSGSDGIRCDDHWGLGANPLTTSLLYVHEDSHPSTGGQYSSIYGYIDADPTDRDADVFANYFEGAYTSTAATGGSITADTAAGRYLMTYDGTVNYASQGYTTGLYSHVTLGGSASYTNPSSAVISVGYTSSTASTTMASLIVKSRIDTQVTNVKELWFKKWLPLGSYAGAASTAWSRIYIEDIQTGTAPTTLNGIKIDVLAAGSTNWGIYNLSKQLAGDKICFTQTDGNEYIDSLADGYVDIGATTAVRINAPLLAYTGDILIPDTKYIHFGDPEDISVGGTGTAGELKFVNTDSANIEFEFQGTSDDGILYWIGGSDYFQFNDDIMMNGDEKIYFKQSGEYIYSEDGYFMDYCATTAHRIRTGGLSGIPDEITATSGGIAASISTLNTEVTTNGDSDLDNVTLANGISGQIKNIYCVAEGNAADTWKITPANMLGGTQITFAGVGEGCTLIYADNEGWVVIANNGGTIS